MKGPFQLVTPDRLQIRESGGCMAVFGLPFFAAGVVLFLMLAGVVPVSNAGNLPALAWPLLVLMAIACTAVGGGLAFGRSWTTVDRVQREVIKEWGLLIPMHDRILSIDGYTTVTLGFVQGDSDSADRFPVALKARSGPDVQLGSFTDYGTARECARAVAAHLAVDIEDASTDHPVRLPASQIDVPFRQRMQRESAPRQEALRPPGARSTVTREMGTVTIVIPANRLHASVLAAALIPIAIPFVIGPPLAAFFKRSNTPDPVGWAFLGFLTLFFGILPAVAIISGFVRSRRGGTLVEVSKQGLRIRERRAWTTRTVASFDAEDILDVDYSSHESSVASARRATEQQVLQAYPSAQPTVSERVERLVTKLARFAKGKGVTVKTRTALFTFAQGLDDEEVRYLHSVVRRALVE